MFALLSRAATRGHAISSTVEADDMLGGNMISMPVGPINIIYSILHVEESGTIACFKNVEVLSI